MMFSNLVPITGSSAVAAPDRAPAPEVAAAVAAELGSEPVSWDLVTKLRGNRLRRAYRVRLADGRTTKVRYFTLSEQAEDVESHLAALGSRSFPRVYCRTGHYMVLEWVPGEALDSVEPEPDLYRECGSLLAQIHLTPLPVKVRARYRLPWRKARLTADVESLRAWGVLTPREAARLADSLRRHIPGGGELHLTHNDFCGENLVLGPDRRIYSIDNEGLKPGIPEADVARTLIRWNLSGQAEEQFLSGYRELRPLDGFPQQRRVWELVSLLGSVRFRYRCKAADFSTPLTQLKSALARPVS